MSEITKSSSNKKTKNQRQETKETFSNNWQQIVKEMT